MRRTTVLRITALALLTLPVSARAQAAATGRTAARSYTVILDGARIGTATQMTSMATPLPEDSEPKPRPAARPHQMAMLAGAGEVQVFMTTDAAGAAKLDAWQRGTQSGNAQAARQLLELDELDSSGGIARRYLFHDAVPRSLTREALRAGSTTAPITTLDVSYRQLEIR